MARRAAIKTERKMGHRHIHMTDIHAFAEFVPREQSYRFAMKAAGLLYVVYSTPHTGGNRGIVV